MEKRIAALQRLEMQLQGTRLMGFLDILTGKRKLKAPAESRLFAMSTAAITLEMNMELHSAEKAAIVFQPLATADFSAIVTDMEEVLRGTGEDTGTTVERTDDSFGYRWMVLGDDEFEDLVVGVNVVSQALAGRRLRRADPVRRVRLPGRRRQARLLDLQLQARLLLPVRARGRRAAPRQRARAALKAQIGTELPVEPELERWFPLWGIPI